MKNLFVPAVMIMFFFYSCTTTSDKPAVLAVYNLGSADSCTGAIVAGRYVADTTVTAANTVTITVNVTTPGPYWIITDSANGIMFSNIGTFTATGPQTAVLTATGTPLDTGKTNFTLTPKNGSGGSCTFSIATVKGIPPHYYLTCFFNGMFQNFGDSVGATNSSIPGNSGQPGLDISGIDTVINSTKKIELGVNVSGGAGAGIYTDTTSAQAYFNYKDSLAQSWSVISFDQPSFTINVTNVNAAYVQGTFSGIIKKQSGTITDSISVTNGMFSVPVH